MVESTVHITIPNIINEQNSPETIRDFLWLLLRGIVAELLENDLGKTTLEGVDVPLAASAREGDTLYKIMHKIGWVYNICYPDGTTTRYINGESFILKD